MSIGIDRLSFVVLKAVDAVRLSFDCGKDSDLIVVGQPQFDLPRQLNDGFCGFVMEYGISPPNIFYAIL